MSPGFIWMLVGIALCGAELVHPGAFLLWIGLAATGTGGFVLATGMPFVWQVASFVALLAGLLCVPLLRGRPSVGGGVNAPDRDLLGKTCRAVSFDGTEGRVRFRDGTWSARLENGPVPGPGAILRVVGLEGTTLIVVATPDADLRTAI